MSAGDAVSSSLRPVDKAGLPGQVVLVMQGGGAPGCYQAGAYQALHEAGIEPDWVIGTSIGAINGAIICGNKVEDRLENCGNSGHVWKRRHGRSANRAADDRRAGLL